MIRGLLDENMRGHHVHITACITIMVVIQCKLMRLRHDVVFKENHKIVDASADRYIIMCASLFSFCIGKRNDVIYRSQMFQIRIPDRSYFIAQLLLR